MLLNTCRNPIAALHPKQPGLAAADQSRGSWVERRATVEGQCTSRADFDCNRGKLEQILALPAFSANTRPIAIGQA